MHKLLSFLVILFSFFVCYGQDVPEAIVWNNEVIDLQTFSILEEEPNFVWNIDKLIDAPMEYDDSGVDTLEFERWRLKYRISVHDLIENDAIVGYTILAETLPKPKAGWEYSPEKALALGKKMHVLLDANKIIIAIYSPIASGCDLVCVDLQTGREIWHAEVKQLMVEHSQYLNNIYLDKIDNRIVLVGNEIGGAYVQVFDIVTGENLFTKIRSK